MKAYERLLKYVQYPTASDEESETCPRTSEQTILGMALVDEMKELGISNAYIDDNGYVYGEIPASEGCENAPVIGFIAHMDVVREVPFTNIKPQIVEYNGGDVLLNEKENIYLSCKEFPEMEECKGQHLIVTDGTTLLGADDKNGIAEILTAAEEILSNPEIKHGKIMIGFTPDEEVGRGADKFDIPGFGADYAYTVDGGAIGEMEYENFNAAGAKVVVHGLNIHPGAAKNKMVNSQLIAMEFNSLLPAAQRPEHTDGYEGFIMLMAMQGEVEESSLVYIIRDHDMEKFQAKKQVMEAAAAFINAKYGEGTLELKIRDSYFNMKKCIEPCMFVVERAMKAMEAVGMTPKTVPIRGGTDGARLSYEGLPCPNLCTGGENYHGRFEYIPVEDMKKCVEMLVALMTSL